MGGKRNPEELKSGGLSFGGYRAEEPAVSNKPLHRKTEEQAVRETEAFGFSCLGRQALSHKDAAWRSWPSKNRARTLG